ncbi:HoxN/HupN/NixA family nickel/cobalt transporter [Terrilactibacillus laevilacticus]|uniref:Nickel/cobalt efflux system n=1 Tax=Terrilactibacillus laevilacticus TaxID=1380157 RepID=A0ABW5PLX4_9BACI
MFGGDEVKKEQHRFQWLGFGVASIVVHIVGISLLIMSISEYPAILGLGIVAYTLGLRHAFDADHIATIDNTVRKLVQQKQDASGVGFFFSLGHSSVVFLMTLALGLSVRWAQKHMPMFEHIGGTIGATVSGIFLVIIGMINLMILVDLRKLFIRMKHDPYDHLALEKLLDQRGFMSRLFRPLFSFVSRSWHVYPLGFLFGLGFDTASEVALLALSAGAAKSAMPFIGILSLPLLFAAGMNIMDTADGIFMTHAYKWAFHTPIRKVYYNITVTAVSVAAAFLIGFVELAQVSKATFHLEGAFWNWLGGLDLGYLGYGLVIILLGSWFVSVVIWKVFRIEEKWMNHRT